MNRRLVVQFARIDGTVFSLAASLVFLIFAFSGSPIVSSSYSMLGGIGLLCLGLGLLLSGSRRFIAGVFVLAFIVIAYSNEVYLLCTGRGRWSSFILLTALLVIFLLGIFGVIKSEETP